MNNREKKLKKIKKKHIVGPILLLIVYAIVVAIVIVTMSSATASFMLDGVMAKNIGISRVVEEEYKARMAAGMDEETVVQDIAAKYAEDVEVLAVLDNRWQTVCATGEVTADSTKDLRIAVSSSIVQVDILGFDVEVYMDKLERTSFDIRKLPLDFGDTEKMSQEAMELVYWVPSKISGERLILAKYRSSVEWRIVWTYLFFIGFTGILTCLPVIIILKQIIATFINQHKMTKILYFDSSTGGNNWLYAKMNGGKYLKKNQGRDYAIVDFELVKYRSYCTCHGVEQGENLLEKMDLYMKKMCKSREMYAHNSKANFLLLLVGPRKDITDRVQQMWRDMSQMEEKHRIEFHAGILYMDEEKRLEFRKNSKKKKDGEAAQNIESLYHCASMARATLANTEGNALAFYNIEMLQKQVWEHKVEDMMEAALINEEFLVYLQPKYDPTQDRLIAAEALVRWNSPTEGFISPGRFIPIFEKTGFIKKLDDYMISHVAKQQADWLAQGRQIVPISVNVSRAHFADPDLAEHIAKLVDEYNTPHEGIEIELTESAFFDDKEMILNTVRRLQELGFEVSMDDFGAGYSSLNSLKDLPLNILKLDAEFFRGENSKERGKIVVSEAIRLAKSLNMKIVAEGVEEEDQVDFLASNGCDMIQGFFYAKPMPVDEFAVSAFETPVKPRKEPKMPEAAAEEAPVADAGVTAEEAPVADAGVTAEEALAAEAEIAAEETPVAEAEVTAEEAPVTEAEAAAEEVPVAEAEITAEEALVAEVEAAVKEELAGETPAEEAAPAKSEADDTEL